jgi:RNA polymerase sigma factor (sigma-70 family)
MAAPTSDPRSSELAVDAEALYLSNREVIERVLRFVCRRARMTPDDAEEFASRVHLRFVESNYEPLRRFEGRSSLQTYLTIVIQRMFLDYRIERWGRFRPSAIAKSAGPAAVRLEQLMIRDGRPLDDAICTVAAEMRQPVDRDALAALSARFPSRVRREFAGEELLETLAADQPDIETMLLRAEREQRLRRIHALVRDTLAGWTADDRVIVQLRFEQGLTVAEIARTLQLDQKPLYRRIEQLLGRLRMVLESAGVRADDISDANADWTGNPDGPAGKVPSDACLKRMER